MKDAFTLFLVVSFISIAVFGMLAVRHSADEHGGCIAAFLNGTDCPLKNGLGFIAFHWGALKSFTTSLPMFAALLAFALFFLRLRFLSDIGPPALFLQTSGRRAARGSFGQYAKKKFIRWLALHTRRDPALAGF